MLVELPCGPTCSSGRHVGWSNRPSLVRSFDLILRIFHRYTIDVSPFMVRAVDRRERSTNRPRLYPHGS
jgi:hypothetical protein